MGEDDDEALEDEDANPARAKLLRSPVEGLGVTDGCALSVTDATNKHSATVFVNNDSAATGVTITVIRAPSAPLLRAKVDEPPPRDILPIKPVKRPRDSVCEVASVSSSGSAGKRLQPTPAEASAFEIESVDD